MKRRTYSCAIGTEILKRSRRRCAVCYALSGDHSQKVGQIAHIDHNPSNNNSDNLLFLCLLHHNQYDEIARQSKRLTINEVKEYRLLLDNWIKRNLPITEEENNLKPVESIASSSKYRLNRDQCKYNNISIENISNILNISKEEVPTELNKMRKLLNNCYEIYLSLENIAILACIINEVNQREIRRGMIETKSGYSYISRDIYEILRILVHNKIIVYNEEVDSEIILLEADTWRSILALCEKYNLPIKKVLKNPNILWCLL